ncbi:MAG: hydrogenase maturation protease [Bacteroidia bacterium]|nr:hydrogenase maturation protease [Bacteroidia bacterium]
MRSIEQNLSQRINQPAGKEDGKNILVLGIGNYLMGDEGIGVHFIHELVNKKLSFDKADILDGGVGGFMLMNYFDSYDHVIFIDATMDGKADGTISLIKPKFASDFPKALSAHDFGLKDMIESLYLLGRVPELYLFTISIPEIKPMTMELSAEVEASIPELIKKVRTLISQINERTE